MVEGRKQAARWHIHHQQQGRQQPGTKIETDTENADPCPTNITTSTIPMTSTFTSIAEAADDEVPRKLHFIWLGNELPRSNIETIQQQSRMNPEYEIHFWSDRAPSARLIHAIHAIEQAQTLQKASSPESQSKEMLKYHNVTQYLQEGLFINSDLIQKQTNLAGKSDYIRMEAVYLEGGIYQDTDAIPLTSFDSIVTTTMNTTTTTTKSRASDRKEPNRASATSSVLRVFSKPFVTYAGNLCNCVFGFEQHSTFLKFAMHLASDACHTYNYCRVGESAGPTLMTAAVLIYAYTVALNTTAVASSTNSSPTLAVVGQHRDTLQIEDTSMNAHTSIYTNSAHTEPIQFIHQKYLTLGPIQSNSTITIHKFDGTWLPKRAQQRARKNKRQRNSKIDQYVKEKLKLV